MKNKLSNTQALELLQKIRTDLTGKRHNSVDAAASALEDIIACLESDVRMEGTNHPWVGRIGTFEDWNFPDICARIVSVSDDGIVTFANGRKCHKSRFKWWSDNDCHEASQRSK